MALLRVRLRRLRLSKWLLIFGAAGMVILLFNYHRMPDSPVDLTSTEVNELRPWENDANRQAYRKTLMAKKFGLDKDEDGEDTSQSSCRLPRLTLETDANRFAFHEMEPLDCGMVELFTLRNSELRLNGTVLGTRRLDRCVYTSISWLSDTQYTESEPVERKPPGPFDMKLNDEFIHVQCFLHKDDKSRERDEMTSLEQRYTFNTARRLLNTELGGKSSRNTSIREIVRGIKQRSSGVVEHAKQLPLSPEDGQSLTERPPGRDSRMERPKSVGGVGLADAPLSAHNAPSEQRDNLVDENNLETEDMNATYVMNEEQTAVDQSDEDYTYVETPDFDQYFVQLIPKPEILKRAKESEQANGQYLNVLIFAFDSMSHLTYQRKLPKTYAYLRDTLGSVILNGYNIVGDATTGAIIPLLTGHTEAELPDVRKGEPGSTYVDSYPLIWNKFEQRGYATLYSEDKPDIAVFNMRLNGFEEVPVDHYQRPFYQAVLQSSLHQISAGYCTGGHPSHLYMIDYVQQFFDRYPLATRRFAFAFLNDLSHDDNNPAVYADDDMVAMLSRLRSGGHLDRTLVIMMGDHGARYSAVRHTTQGKLEERLPMMSLTFPRWFRKAHPKHMAALRANADRLTSPFDIHATLLSLLNLPNSLSKQRLPRRRGVSPGLSLLLPHPMNRTCAEAGIAPHWCTCMKWQEMDVKNENVRVAADRLVEHIIAETESYRSMCTLLRLKDVVDAKVGYPNKKVLTFMHTVDREQSIANFTNQVKSDVVFIQLIVRTEPGEGLYEGTVTISDTGDTYQVAPDISRINRYGDQAHCVEASHPNLRKYCLCKEPKDGVSDRRRSQGNRANRRT